MWRWTHTSTRSGWLQPPTTYLGAASALLRLKKFDDAAQQAQHVVEDATAEAPHISLAHEVLARIALGRRNLDLARTEAALAERATPSARRGVRERSNRLRSTALPGSARVVRGGTNAARQEWRGPLADLRLFTAETLQRLERLSEAEYLFLEELKGSPLNGRARAGLTAVYSATGRTARPPPSPALIHRVKKKGEPRGSPFRRDARTNLLRNGSARRGTRSAVEPHEFVEELRRAGAGREILQADGATGCS